MNADKRQSASKPPTPESSWFGKPLIWFGAALIAGLLSLLFPGIGNRLDELLATIGMSGGQLLPPVVVLAAGMIMRVLTDTDDSRSTKRSRGELVPDFLEVTASAAAHLNKEGRIVATNQLWQESFGKSFPQGATIADSLAGEQRNDFVKAMQDAVIDDLWCGDLYLENIDGNSTAVPANLRHFPACTSQPAAFILQFAATSDQPLAAALAPLPLAVLGVDADNRISVLNDEAERFFPDASTGVSVAAALPAAIAQPLSEGRRSHLFALNLDNIPQIRGWIIQEPGHVGRTILAEDVSDQLAMQRQAATLAACCETITEICDQLATTSPDQFGKAVKTILNATAHIFSASAVAVARHHNHTAMLQLLWSTGGTMDEATLTAHDEDSGLYRKLINGETAKYDGPPLPAPFRQGTQVWCIPARIADDLIGALVVAVPQDIEFPGAYGPVATIIAMLLSGNVDRRRQLDLIDDLQNQLRQSQRLETVGILAGGIAHDFSNILTPITGFLQFAMQDLDPESQTHADLEHVREGVERARNLISQILSFSRGSESGRSIINPADVVRSTVKLIRGPLPTTITLSTDLQSQHLVDADPGQIHQVVLNICTNAYQAMCMSGGELSVKLDRRSLDRDHPDLKAGMSPGDYVCIAIADNGPGMPPEVAEHIFEPFFTTKPEGEGTGLGLVVVSGIVISHGGGIAITTAPGEGTEFRVYLPVADNVEATVADNVEATVPEATDATPEATPALAYKVLFCDDEGGISDLARRRLNAKGMTVIACQHAGEALAAFKNAPAAFDVVVTDQTMPEMTGTELIEAIHAIRPELPAILASGYSPTFSGLDMEDDAVCAQFGARKFLRKPYMMDDLAKAIDTVVTAEQ